MKRMEERMREFEKVKPIFDHYGLLTYDRERAKDFLMAIPGSKILVDREVDFPQEIVRVGKPVKIKIYHIEVSGMDVEVIQPVDSPDAYITKCLENHGDSFHHLALTFETHSQHMAMCKILEERGYHCVFEGVPRDLLVQYYEHEAGSGITLELKSVRG